ncbi:MAG: response regulator transcription factor [Thermomicrobium sp.]|nr:response regulator transcription factor [Thermomicrobium sp.]MDW8006676.1 response regulator transcription factor [Thermomicrobium sp.]
MARILVIEDEIELARHLRTALEQAGHTVATAYDGPSGLALARSDSPDLVILDLMLPGMDGLDVLRALRRESLVPVLVLTARSAELDRVVGLELGADDYVVKPFSLREVVARVRAILRRVEAIAEASRLADREEPIVLPDLLIDPATREVRSGGQPVQLTAREFALLWFLAANPGRVFSRDYLLERVWGTESCVGERAVDACIARIRKKLGGAGSPADRIVAYWGVGYRFERREGDR